MPPKPKGRPKKQISNGAHSSSPTVPAGSTSIASIDMAISSRRSTRSKGKEKATNQNVVPEIYRDMLAEALPALPEVPERPLKKRRVGPRNPTIGKPGPSKDVLESHDTDEDEDIEFEDILPPAKLLDNGDLDEDSDSDRPQQTMYRDSDEETVESDIDWENVNFDGKDDEPSGDLELTLSTKSVPQNRINPPRRKAISQSDKIHRLEIHKMHILCLLAHVDQRNDWCNDPAVHDLLRPLLNKNTKGYLRPREDLSQFSQAESLKRGLDQAAIIWRTQFEITKRGLRRALWADDEEHIKNYKLPDDADSSYEMADFRKAAKSLQGSRDVGAQLFCALLRSVDVEARLVCSLQPLSFTTGGPSMPKPPKIRAQPTPPASNATSASSSHTPSTSSQLLSNPRHRLGHPSAAAYHLPSLPATPAPPSKPKPKPIRESPFPIFWVEVLDAAHQKWIAVDPLVTESIAKPQKFEPPLTDKENLMNYVIAFSPSTRARDVTRRYVKAPNAKTRRTRVESMPGGLKWWGKTMRYYSRGWKDDVERIEDGELAAQEAREPMPKNVQDFKDHPVYALERHLRRNEVIVATRESGKVATGKDPSVPGGRRMENVYRRKDVRVCRSADAWYRMGREVKMGEVPLKVVMSRKKPDENLDEEEEVDTKPGTNLYSEEQTELYIPPPIVNGRVPKNAFGNIDIYVESMVPEGGVHVEDEEAVKAVRLLGVDSARALVKWEFRGRRGTPVLKGVVVAREYEEATRAVVEGLRWEAERELQQRKEERVLGYWRRFLLGLRVWERVSGYKVDGEEGEKEEEVVEDDVPDENNDGDEDGDETGGFVKDDTGDDEEQEGENEGGGFVKDGEEQADEEDEGGFVKQDEEADDSSELSDTYTDEDYDDDMAGGFFPE